MNIKIRCRYSVVFALSLLSAITHAQGKSTVTDSLDRLVAEVTPAVIAWRHDIHQHPELGNRETRTAGLVAAHLRSLGMEVQTGVAHTGVVAVLRGGRPGGTVALRADMDALPVTEEVDVPFASRVRTMHNGSEVGVMHACGHDAHTAILMGVAEVLAALRATLPGSVKFIFQPAEEGPPAGEQGGATMMIAEGVLQNPKPDAIFALHTMPAPTGLVGYRVGGILSGADTLHITVKGRQTHGALPWSGVDPIVVASQIVLGLQLIPSRQLDPRSATVISIGSIHAGLRANIIPEQVDMEGTIRILDPSTRDDVLARIKTTAEKIADASGASAQVRFTPYAPVTYNDPVLTRKMLPTLQRVAGPGAVEVRPWTPSEDFAHFQQHVPGLYVFLGRRNRAGVALGEAAPNHSPHYYVNDDSLPLGVNVLASLAVDFLSSLD